MTADAEQAPFCAGLPTDLGSPRRARQLLTEWLQLGGCSTDTIDDLVYAVSEVVTNSVEHAQLPTSGDTITVAATTRTEGTRTQVVITVTDTGRWRPPPVHKDNRGRGLPMIEGLVAHLQIEPTDSGTRVRMTSHPC